MSLRLNPCPRGSQSKRGHAPCPNRVSYRWRAASHRGQDNLAGRVLPLVVPWRVIVVTAERCPAATFTPALEFTLAGYACGCGFDMRIGRSWRNVPCPPSSHKREHCGLGRSITCYSKAHARPNCTPTQPARRRSARACCPDARSGRQADNDETCAHL